MSASGVRHEAKLVPDNGKLEVRAAAERDAGLLARAGHDGQSATRALQNRRRTKPVDPTISTPFDSTAASRDSSSAAALGQCRSVASGFVATCAPLVRDVIITGLNRDELGALAILDLDGCRGVNPALPAGDLAAAAADPLFRARFGTAFGICREPTGPRPGSPARPAGCTALRRPQRVTDKARQPACVLDFAWIWWTAL